jgi:CRP-like cAMP-binding protein
MDEIKNEERLAVSARALRPSITSVNGINSRHVGTAQALGVLAGCELPDWPALEQATTRLQLAPGDPLFLAGTRCPQVFVVNAGLIKMLYETAGGDSWVKGFAEPGICFASLTALEPQGCTSFAAYAVVASTVDQIDYAQLQRLVDRHPSWQRLLSNAFKLYGQRKEQRERELLTLSPEQRYVEFLRRHRDVAAVLRQHDIASYVRVTPVALSRIKSRIKARVQDE